MEAARLRLRRKVSRGAQLPNRVANFGQRDTPESEVATHCSSGEAPLDFGFGHWLAVGAPSTWRNVRNVRLESVPERFERKIRS